MIKLLFDGKMMYNHLMVEIGDKIIGTTLILG